MNTLLEDPVHHETTPGNRGTSKRRYRVLIVEDDDYLREFMGKVMERFGYQSGGAIDGQDGWNALCAGNYDLVITDNNMPD